jgi:hypothetical protein
MLEGPRNIVAQGTTEECVFGKEMRVELLVNLVVRYLLNGRVC